MDDDCDGEIDEGCDDPDKCKASEEGVWPRCESPCKGEDCCPPDTEAPLQSGDPFAVGAGNSYLRSIDTRVSGSVGDIILAR
ncbi:MAG: hypothetical protein HYZ28_04175 [Myxococcales bacterium]|nr:hypothetical protein [Myxococcales bacterium]